MIYGFMNYGYGVYDVRVRFMNYDIIIFFIRLWALSVSL